MRNVSLNLGSGEHGRGCHARPLCRTARPEATALAEVLGGLREAQGGAHLLAPALTQGVPKQA